jgi:photosynthetic reaction center cytochrome c subunit
MRFCTSVFSAVFFIVVFAAVAAPPPPPPAQAPAAPDPNKAEGRYKNIQVFKGYPADDLVPAMQFISNSLGVDCDFCHVERAPEKDDKKEKQTARKMITMTLAINHDHFDGHREVTCVSCHRGAPRPVAIPIIAADGPAPAPAPPVRQAVDLPAASTVLDNYLQAVGGAEAIAKIGSRVQRGKLSGFGPEPVPVDVSAKAPDRRITIVHGQRGDNTTAVNGRTGWLGNTGRPPRDMSAAESDAARLDAALLFPSDLKRLFKEFEVAQPEKIDGKDVVKLIAKNEGKPETELWFDAQSGLVVRLKRYAETPLGRNPTQIDFADYRDADGVKIPFRWTVARPSGRFTIQLDDSQQNVPVDDKTFEKASQAPAS